MNPMFSQAVRHYIIYTLQMDHWELESTKSGDIETTSISKEQQLYN